MQVETNYTSGLSGLNLPKTNERGLTVIRGDEPAEDNVTLSDSSQKKFAEISDINKKASPKLDGSVTNESLEELSKKISNKIGAILFDNFIFQHDEIKFSLNEYGEVKIEGDFPNKEAVEKAINSDKSLVNDIANSIGEAKALAIIDIQEEYQIKLGNLDKEDDEDEEKKKQSRFEIEQNLQAKVEGLMKQVSGANSFAMNSSGAITYSAMSIAASF